MTYPDLKLKLTKNQRKIIYELVECQKRNFMGYFETGKYKPFAGFARSLWSLRDKGLIEFKYTYPNLFHDVKLTTIPEVTEFEDSAYVLVEVHERFDRHGELAGRCWQYVGPIFACPSHLIKYTREAYKKEGFYNLYVKNLIDDELQEDFDSFQWDY